MNFQSAAGAFEEDNVLRGVVECFLGFDAEIPGAFSPDSPPHCLEGGADGFVVGAEAEIVDGVDHGE
jgi:hypothetical protein